MGGLRRAALGALALVSALGCGPAPEWRRAEAAGVSVELPGEPRRAVETAAASLEVDLGTSWYGVRVTEWPPEHAAARSAPELLAPTRAGYAARAQGGRVAERPVALGPHPGREYDFTTAGGAEAVRSRALVVGARLVQLTVVARGRAGLPAHADRFLASLELLHEQPVLAAPRTVLRPFTSPEDGFAALLPGTPERAARATTSPEGSGSVVTWTGELDGRLFGVHVTAFPTGVATLPAEALLLRARRAAAADAGLRVLGEGPATVGGEPALDFRFEDRTSGARVASLACVSRGRLYQALVVTPAAWSAPAGAACTEDERSFFAAFAPLPGPAPTQR